MASAQRNVVRKGKCLKIQLKYSCTTKLVLWTYLWIPFSIEAPYAVVTWSSTEHLTADPSIRQHTKCKACIMDKLATASQTHPTSYINSSHWRCMFDNQCSASPEAPQLPPQRPPPEPPELPLPPPSLPPPENHSSSSPEEPESPLLVPARFRTRLRFLEGAKWSAA